MRKFDKNAQIKILKIILIIIWMIIVFVFSGQKGTESSDTSKSFTVTIIQMITGKQIDENNHIIEKIETIVRKLAHYTIYNMGGFLIMNYAYTEKKSLKEKILYSICFGGGYAITDELHQFFVPGRSARIFDVGIDTLGVITGVLIYVVIRKTIEITLKKYKTKGI